MFSFFDFCSSTLSLNTVNNKPVCPVSGGLFFSLLALSLPWYYLSVHPFVVLIIYNLETDNYMQYLSELTFNLQYYDGEMRSSFGKMNTLHATDWLWFFFMYFAQYSSSTLYFICRPPRGGWELNPGLLSSEGSKHLARSHPLDYLLVSFHKKLLKSYRWTAKVSTMCRITKKLKPLFQGILYI